MGNFDRRSDSRNDRRGGFGGRKRSFGDRNRFGRDRGERQMYKVVCSNCGKDCEVPFRPTNDKPVYCSDCFEKFGGRNNRKSFDRPRNEGRSGGNDNFKSQLESLNSKLDKIISLLQPQVVEKRPSEQKVVQEVVVEKDEETPKKKKVTRKKTVSAS